MGRHIDHDLGDPVVASASGTVDVVRDLGGTSYGRYVRINHGGGWTTYYAHLNGFNVSVGQSVGYGRVIGWVGSTGGSTVGSGSSTNVASKGGDMSSVKEDVEVKHDIAEGMSASSDAGGGKNKPKNRNSGNGGGNR